jgi:hypothetical protein
VAADYDEVRPDVKESQENSLEALLPGCLGSHHPTPTASVTGVVGALSGDVVPGSAKCARGLQLVLVVAVSIKASAVPIDS